MAYISKIKTPDNVVYDIKDAHATDELVKQTESSVNATFPLLASASSSPTSGVANDAIYHRLIKINPGYCNFSIGDVEAVDGQYSIAFGDGVETHGNASFVGGLSHGDLVNASADASFCFGYTDGNGKIMSDDWGAVAIGCATGIDDIQNCEILASAEGSIAVGRTGDNSRISSSSLGAFAGGFAGTYHNSSSSQIYSSGSGAYSHGYAIDGGYIAATGDGSTACGYANGYSEAEGNCYENGISAAGIGSFAFGCAAGTEGQTNIQSFGHGSVAGGYTDETNGGIRSIGKGSVALGYSVKALGAGASAFGCLTQAVNDYSHAEGYMSVTSGAYLTGLSSAGPDTAGFYAHAEGNSCVASGAGAHAEGLRTFAKGDYSHAEGRLTKATNIRSHAEGHNTTASGSDSHSECSETTASGWASHAEGYHTSASGSGSHAEGYYTTASGGNGSHSGGYYTQANTSLVTAIGRCNMATTAGDLFVVGNGSTSTNRKTVFKVSDLNSSATGGNDCVVTITGKVNASSGFYQTSDINRKNIQGDFSLDTAYNLIDKCLTILYTLKEDPENKVLIGLIALEVQEFFPEIISVDLDGNLSLDYSRLTVVILKVLKDILKRINDLESKLNV